MFGVKLIVGVRDGFAVQTKTRCQVRSTGRGFFVRYQCPVLIILCGGIVGILLVGVSIVGDFVYSSGVDGVLLRLLLRSAGLSLRLLFRLLRLIRTIYQLLRNFSFHCHLLRDFFFFTFAAFKGDFS